MHGAQSSYPRSGTPFVLGPQVPCGLWVVVLPARLEDRFVLWRRSLARLVLQEPAAHPSGPDGHVPSAFRRMTKRHARALRAAPVGRTSLADIATLSTLASLGSASRNARQMAAASAFNPTASSMASRVS